MLTSRVQVIEYCLVTTTGAARFKHTSCGDLESNIEDQNSGNLSASAVNQITQQ